MFYYKSINYLKRRKKEVDYLNYFFLIKNDNLRYVLYN